MQYVGVILVSGSIEHKMRGFVIMIMYNKVLHVYGKVVSNHCTGLWTGLLDWWTGLLPHCYCEFILINKQEKLPDYTLLQSVNIPSCIMHTTGMQLSWPKYGWSNPNLFMVRTSWHFCYISNRLCGTILLIQLSLVRFEFSVQQSIPSIQSHD